MLQRRTAPGRFVGKCRSTMTDAPDRLSCSISERGAERTNASEMQGARPVTTYCSVRPPRHVPPSALTLNTVSPPNRYHSKIGFACNSVMPISCHRHRKVTDRHRKVTRGRQIPEKRLRRVRCKPPRRHFRNSGTRLPPKNKQRNALMKHRDGERIADLLSLSRKPRRNGAAFPTPTTKLAFVGPAPLREVRGCRGAQVRRTMSPWL